MKKRRASFSDPLLFRRIEEHLRENPAATADDITEYLLHYYREYARKPQKVLRTLVVRSLERLRTDFDAGPGADDGEGSIADTADDDMMPEDGGDGQVADAATLNNALRSVYREHSAPSTPVSSRPGSPARTPSASGGGGTDKAKKKRRREPGSSSRSAMIALQRPSDRFADVGGIEHCLQDIRELIEYPLTHPEIYAHLGVEPPRGVLLHGPPGCGKSLLANAIAGELGVPLLRVSGPEVVGGMSGESERQLRDLFSQAVESAPCILFLDEIDSITPKRETAAREMERRIVAQLLTCMDDLTLAKTNQRAVIVLGATNRPDALDPALRRAGRFDREISLGIPDEDARAHILRVLSKRMRLSGDFDFLYIARRTPGFVGADLQALCKEAAVLAINRIFGAINVTGGKANAGNAETEGTPAMGELTLADRQRTSAMLRQHAVPLSSEQLAPLCVEMSDFVSAIDKVQPSAKREGFATIPGVTWEDIGSLSDVREELTFSIIEPIIHPERYAAVGLRAPAGVLLYGPPGCGKTLLSKAVANESGANFISVKGPELLNKYVGESERAVRQVFARARNSAPCVVFFDELDALCPRRGSEGNAAQERVVNQLLTEMDGVDGRENVFVIAATNRPDIIDPAMLRPGRLDKLVYVPLPTEAGRADILRTACRSVSLALDVDLEAVARDPRTSCFSGADLAALVREAGMFAIKECAKMGDGSGVPLIRAAHFADALGTVLPSVSAKDQRLYNAMKARLRRSRGKLDTEGGGENHTAATGSTPTEGDDNAMLA